MKLLPLSQGMSQLQSFAAIANEVVVNDEYFVPPAKLAQRVEFPDHLGRRFRPRASSVNRYNVAEFALKRAPTRELNGHRHVLVESQQIVARNRTPRHVRLFRHAVQMACGALFERSGNIGKDFFRFSDEYVVR